MGTLTPFLQHSFAAACPTEWTCQAEVSLFSQEIEKVLGYAPRADVLLTRRDGSQRIWIEFEVSRADPVANHAKFASGQLFRPLAPTDLFVAMVSSHVDRGRRNLAAATILLMRSLGIRAFQTVLLPSLSPQNVKRLNHLSYTDLAHEGLAIPDELNRVFTIVEPVQHTTKGRLHVAGDLLEVMLNVQRWNTDMATHAGQASWGRRVVTYLVADPRTGQFAPSKFCAYVHLPAPASPATLVPELMTVQLYTSLDKTEKVFDGHRARMHLTKQLAMQQHHPDDVPALRPALNHWLATHAHAIAVHPNGLVLLLPPAWF